MVNSAETGLFAIAAAMSGFVRYRHRGKPGWQSGAVFEAPALVAGFDDFAMLTVNEEKAPPDPLPCFRFRG